MLFYSEKNRVKSQDGFVFKHCFICIFLAAMVAFKKSKVKVCVNILITVLVKTFLNDLWCTKSIHYNYQHKIHLVRLKKTLFSMNKTHINLLSSNKV